MDVDAIPLGVDFTKTLRAEVAKCDVLLAVIGPAWIATDEGGNRRLRLAWAGSHAIEPAALVTVVMQSVRTLVGHGHPILNLGHSARR
jgi:hypothetical protein